MRWVILLAVFCVAVAIGAELDQTPQYDGGEVAMMDVALAGNSYGGPNLHPGDGDDNDKPKCGFWCRLGRFGKKVGTAVVGFIIWMYCSVNECTPTIIY